MNSFTFDYTLPNSQSTQHKRKIHIMSALQNKINDKPDLQIFIEKYEPSKFKELKNSIEVRSVADVEKSSNKSVSLI
jgi:hypothetical protein